MDLIFGDTAAHEEKQRIVGIEAQLRGLDSHTVDPEFVKPFAQEEEDVA